MGKLATWWGRLTRRNQMLTVTLGGIVAGVLLLATGIALVQLAGALLIGVALLVARAGARFPEEGWANPRGQYPALLQSVRSRMPTWFWPVCVAVIVVVLGLFLLARILLGEELSRSTPGDLGKGVIALAMIGTLALWSNDVTSMRNVIRRLRRHSRTADGG